MNRSGNFVFVFIAVLFLFGGTIIGFVVSGGEDSYGSELPLKVASLDTMELETIESYEKYKSFADNTNNLIEILNEQSDWFTLPCFDESEDSWNKISKVLVEYGPLINNYNEVIGSAKKFDENRTEGNLENFYIASSRFGFETVMIAGAFFYTASYQTVGIVYRTSGLQRLAFSCPSCVRVTLSSMHWTVRTGLVETSSLAAKEIIERSPEELDTITLDSLDETTSWRDKGMEVLNSDQMNNTKQQARDVLNSTTNWLKNFIP